MGRESRKPRPISEAKLLGDPKPMKPPTDGQIGDGLPCWAIAIDPTGKLDAWPIAELHGCNEDTAKAIAISIAHTIGQARIIVGSVPACRHAGGRRIEVLNPVVIQQTQRAGH